MSIGQYWYLSLCYCLRITMFCALMFHSLIILFIYFIEISHASSKVSCTQNVYQYLLFSFRLNMQKKLKLCNVKFVSSVCVHSKVEKLYSYLCAQIVLMDGWYSPTLNKSGLCIAYFSMLSTCLHSVICGFVHHWIVQKFSSYMQNNFITKDI